MYKMNIYNKQMLWVIIPQGTSIHKDRQTKWPIWDHVSCY